MDPEELQEYIEANSRAIDIFRDKALAFQQQKNSDRSPAKRWNDTLVKNATDKMVEQFVSNVYDKLNASIKENKYHPRDSWIKFIEGNAVLDSLEDSVGELEFNDK